MEGRWGGQAVDLTSQVPDWEGSAGNRRGAPGVRGSYCILKRERSEYVTRLRREPVGSRGRMERR